MAEPVLLISSDPFLGASLEAVARGRLQIARLDPIHRPPAWPATPSTTVVLDVTARQRDPVHTWIRRHHPGPLVILLKPGERHPALPPDPWRVVVARPFRLMELVGLLERSPKPPDRAPEREAPVLEPDDEREEDDQGEGEAERVGDQEQEEASGEGEQEPHPADAGLVPNEAERQPNPARSGPPLGRVADRRRFGATLSTPPTRAFTPPRRPSTPLAQPSTPPPRASIPPRRMATSPAGLSAPVPRPDWPTAATGVGGRRRRPGWPGWRGRRAATRVLVAVLVALLLAGGWLTLGLLQARQDLLVGAAGVRDELARAEVALTRGRPEDAGAAVQAAERSLAVAAAVPERPEVRVAARLPVLSGGIADTRRLLAAAAGLIGAGERAVAVAPRLRSGPRALLRGGRFDLDALDDVTAQARGLVAELEAVRAQLQEVRGGLLEPGVDDTRRWALERLDGALGRARPLVTTLDALPAAVGAGEPRRYLVVLTSPAGRQPAGGVPLAVREVVLDQGVVDLRPGAGELAEALGDVGTSARFPATGRAWLRAAEGRGHPRLDGVIALDPMAMRMLLEATGPVAVPGYGRIGAADAVGRLTADAERRWPARDDRRRYHEAVLASLVGRLLSGHDLVTTGRVLGAAGAGRNLQAYSTDPGLQRMLALHQLDGTGRPRR
jgi:Protein of unknown function (DUF4012)